MHMDIIPSINMKGYFELIPPFSKFMRSKVLYVCKAVRTFTEYNKSESVAVVYTSNGLTSADYLKDAMEHPYMVVLESEYGDILKIPARYIAKLPASSGVMYHTIGLTVNVGPLPVEYDLSGLKADMRSLIMSRLGYDPDIVEMEITKAVLVDYDRHENIVRTRVNMANNTATDNVRLRQTLKLNEDLRLKLTALEEYIKKKYIEAI